MMLLMALTFPLKAYAVVLERTSPESRISQTWTWDGCLGELFVTFQLPYFVQNQ